MLLLLVLLLLHDVLGVSTFHAQPLLPNQPEQSCTAYSLSLSLSLSLLFTYSLTISLFLQNHANLNRVSITTDAIHIHLPSSTITAPFVLKITLSGVGCQGTFMFLCSFLCSFFFVWMISHQHSIKLCFSQELCCFLVLGKVHLFL